MVKNTLLRGKKRVLKQEKLKYNAMRIWWQKTGSSEIILASGC